MNPKVSIVVPVYNAGGYLKPCMDSLLNQTYKDIEIICVLDCPTDGSDKVIEEYAAKDNRIVVIRNEEQLHVGESRNVGLRAARGQYVGFSDHDDFHSLDMYERLWVLTNEGQKNVVFSSATYLDKKERVFKDTVCSGNNNPTIESSVYNLYRGMNTLVTTNIYRKSFLKDNQIFFEDTRNVRAEDMLFNLVVLTKCSMEDISFETKSYYFHNMTQSSHGYTYEYNNITKQIALIDKTLEILNEYHPSDSFLAGFNYLLSLRLYSGFRHEIIKSFNRDKNIFKMINNLRGRLSENSQHPRSTCLDSLSPLVMN